MKSEQLFERLKSKPAYEKFINANPDSYLYAIFCILSKEEKEGDKIQFDFLVKDKKQIALTEYPFDEIKISDKEMPTIPSKLSLKELKIDVEDLWDQVKENQEKNKDKTNVTKIMGILKDGIWDLTCISSTVDIIKLRINADTKECVSFKKENLMNFVQVRKGNKTN